VLSYDAAEGMVRTRRGDTNRIERGSIFDVLNRELFQRAIEPPAEPAGGLVGGFVGYLGYECKADCGSPVVHRSDLPDATLMLANRVVAVDHVNQRTELLALCRDSDSHAAERWLKDAETVVREMLAGPSQASGETGSSGEADWVAPAGRAEQAKPAGGASGQEVSEGHETKDAGGASPPASPASSVAFRCGRGREQYLADIARCQAALAAGESYEVCLTDQISTSASPDPFELYRVLRRVNPAPFAAYLKLGEVAVLSSSPERFLSVDRDRRVQARPIKGTTSRSRDPTLDAELRAGLTQDEKTYAEHLMIVDLLRNDLGRIAELGSVRADDLFAIETYPTLHTMVSTVSARLKHGAGVDGLVRALFPCGSVTGAPKIRAMEIIRELEASPRGL
jgi:para-aminobenzoate synthetase